MKIRILLICVPLICFGVVHPIKAQTISGKVTDATSGVPLIGATVTSLPFTEGGITNEQGVFDLNVTTDTLEVSFVGYRSARIVVRDKAAFLNIGLQPGIGMGTAVVKVERQQVALRIPAAFTRLDSARLWQDDQLSPAPILNQVAGVYMQSGALNTNRITIRGIGNRSPFGTAKIRAYLNEIPLTNGVGETSIEDIDLSMLQRIEVWKGPTAHTYGASLGGVIHLKTATDFPEERTASFSLQAGDYGLLRSSNQIALPVKDRGGFFLNANYTRSDGYRDNNEYDRLGLSMLNQWQWSKRFKSTVLLNFIDLKSFIPSSLSRTDYEDKPQKAAFPWAEVMGFEDYSKLLAALSFSYDWKKETSPAALTSTLSLSGNFRENYESRPFNILEEDSRNLGLRFVTDYRGQRSREQANVRLGLEYFREAYDWQTYETAGGVLDTLLTDQQEFRQYLNVFFAANYDLGKKWFVTAGLNVNYSWYELEAFFPQAAAPEEYTFDPVLSPRLSLGYRLHPRITTFATISHGFSTPTLEETLGEEGQRNPDIQPERGWNYEFGLRGSYLAGKLNAELSVFQMRIEDLLVARRTALDAFIGINAGKTRHNGLEAALTWQWAASIESGISYTFADYYFETFQDGEDDFSGNALTGAPPHQCNAWTSVRLPAGFYGNLRYAFTDAFPMRDDNSLYSDAWHRLDLKLGWRFSLKEIYHLDLWAGTNNLTDSRYASMILVNAGSFGGNAPRYFYPALPRNFYAGLRLNYQL